MSKQPVAKILREFGLGGHLKVRIYLTPPEPFFQYKSFYVETPLGLQEYHVEHAEHKYGNIAIVKFRGIDEKEVAALLRGKELLVEEGELPPKEEGEYYVFELEGLQVIYRGKAIGHIKSILQPGPYPLFRVSTEEEDIYIPFHEEFVDRIDLDEGKVYVKKIPEYEM